MVWLWWIFLFLITLLTIPVTFQFYHYQNHSGIKIKLWPDITLKSISLKKKRTILSDLKKILYWYAVFKNHSFLLFLLQRLKIQRFYWHTMIGFSDAASTGIAVGWLWGVKGFLVSNFYRFFSYDRLPEMSIIPNFCTSCLAVNLDIIISARLGHVLIGTAILWLKRLRKGDVKR